MRILSLAVVAATALCGTAMAEPITRTTTFDGPKYEGTRVVTRDADTRTTTRETDATRKSDGATASRDYSRTRTDTGVAASGSSTGFGGRSSGFDYQRTRTDGGYVESGTATGRAGRDWTLSGSGTRTDIGYTRNRAIANGSGETVYNRDVSQTRANGQVSRSVDVSRKAGFRPRARVAGRR
jgi:hypothetical protein